MLRKALILISAVLGGLALAAPVDPARASVEIVSAEFGIFDASNPREMIFTPTTIVPHKLGQRYGWIIEVRTALRSLSVREEYLLPTAPAPQRSTTLPGATLDMPQQRRNQVSQRQLVPVDGKIYGEWAIGPNEPAGHRDLQVVIEGQAATRFEYDVK